MADKQSSGHNRQTDGQTNGQTEEEQSERRLSENDKEKRQILFISPTVCLPNDRRNFGQFQAAAQR